MGNPFRLRATKKKQSLQLPPVPNGILERELRARGFHYHANPSDAPGAAVLSTGQTDAKQVFQTPCTDVLTVKFSVESNAVVRGFNTKKPVNREGMHDSCACGFTPFLNPRTVVLE